MLIFKKQDEKNVQQDYQTGELKRKVLKKFFNKILSKNKYF